MNLKLRHIILLLASLLFAGCTLNDDVYPRNNPFDPVLKTKPRDFSLKRKNQWWKFLDTVNTISRVENHAGVKIETTMTPRRISYQVIDAKFSNNQYQYAIERRLLDTVQTKIDTLIETATNDSYWLIRTGFWFTDTLYEKILDLPLSSGKAWTICDTTFLLDCHAPYDATCMVSNRESAMITDSVYYDFGNRDYLCYLMRTTFLFEYIVCADTFLTRDSDTIMKPGDTTMVFTDSGSTTHYFCPDFPVIALEYTYQHATVHEDRFEGEIKSETIDYHGYLNAYLEPVDNTLITRTF